MIKKILSLLLFVSILYNISAVFAIVLFLPYKKLYCLLHQMQKSIRNFQKLQKNIYY